MNKIVNISFVLGTFLLSGCVREKIVDGVDPKTKTPVCKLMHEHVSVANASQSAWIGIKKITPQTSKMWITLTSSHSFLNPQTKPRMIIKLFKNKSITEEVSISNANQYSLPETVFANYCDAHQVSYQKTEHEDPFLSANDIWPQAFREYVGSKLAKSVAIYFDLDVQLMEKILASDLVRIYIETSTDPIIVSLEPEAIKSIRQYKDTCKVGG